MKLLNKQKNKICFESDINQSLVNSLRRYVNEIKIIAVDEVEISKNDGPLYDETVAHRIGLIPLKMEKSFKENDEKKLKLKSKKHGFVLSKELKGDVEVIHDEMPITLLNEDQELALTAKVRMGRGKDHSKFSPGLIFYRNVCEMELDKKFSGEISKRFNNKIKEKGNKIIIEDNLEKPLIDFCEGLAIKNKTKAEIKNKKEFIINIESFGQITPEEILNKSLDILKKDLAEVSKKLK